jgi:transmembrane protein TMEM260 (protein O-mannosyltransferase)
MRARAKPAGPAQAAERVAHVPALWSVAVGAAALALYLTLAPPVSGDQDASELTLALAFGGVPHPTGYPLYAMTGHLFCLALHRLGATWSYGANAWSAVGGGVAIAFLHAAAARLVPREARLGRVGRFAWALLPAALFALDPVWTMSAALAEIHSWHVAWVGGVTLLFLSLASRAPLGGRAAAAWGFAVGLGLAHHATALLVAAPLTVALWVAWRRARRPRLRDLLVMALAAAVPLLSYGFVAWRAFHPAVYQWPLLPPSWQGVARHALAGGYGHFLGRFAPSDLQRGFLAAYVYPLLWPALIALIVAAARARRPAERLAAWGIVAAAILPLVYVYQYGVPDPAAYFLPPLFLALLGVPALLALAPAGGAARPWLVALAALGALLLAVPWLRVAEDRRAGFLEVDEHLRKLWGSLPFERGIVLWPSDMHTRFREYQLFERQKPEVFVSSPNLLTFDRPRAEFERRFGVDPLAGITIRSDGDVLQIPANVNRQTTLPVAQVDALGITLQVLPKP